jgi:hypothetical protein
MRICFVYFLFFVTSMRLSVFTFSSESLSPCLFALSLSLSLSLCLCLSLSVCLSLSLAHTRYRRYHKFVVAYCLQDPSTVAPASFPCTLPFSFSCPMICRAVRNLIHDYVAFADYLGPEFDLAIRRAVDAAMAREVRKKRGRRRFFVI